MKKIFILFFVIMTTGGCVSRIDHIGRPPSLSPAGESRVPVASPSIEIEKFYPVPSDSDHYRPVASLWEYGPQSLFGDQRARIKGDILTVVVQIDEEAEITNETDISRAASESLSAPALFGVGTLAQRILPGGAGLDQAVQLNSNSTSTGDGSVQREERITLRVAATVRAVLPNGHMVIQGSQEIRVNNELRDLQVSGIVRKADISRTNEITSDKIAEARISYGGRGTISDSQNPRYGQQVLDAILPF